MRPRPGVVGSFDCSVKKTTAIQQMLNNISLLVKWLNKDYQCIRILPLEGGEWHLCSHYFTAYWKQPTILLYIRLPRKWLPSKRWSTGSVQMDKHSTMQASHKTWLLHRYSQIHFMQLYYINAPIHVYIQAGNSLWEVSESSAKDYNTHLHEWQWLPGTSQLQNTSLPTEIPSQNPPWCRDDLSRHMHSWL